MTTPLNYKLFLFMFLAGLFFLPFASLAAKDQVLEVGRFSKEGLNGWEEKKFKGQTEYSLVTIKEKKVVKAVSHQSSSGLYKNIKVNLDQTPYLNWRWYVQNILGVIDEKTKSGDDYPARVYIMVKTGWLPWELNAISYVWSSVSPMGEKWYSAFSKSVCMIAVESGADKLDTWIKEKRNIQQDYQDCFNQKIQYIDAVAIMSDTDNSKSNAAAYYGDIYFSSR